MPDIGRWNGIDQLAEMYVSTSTYAYVGNNPVLRFDVDGRWFDQEGTISSAPYFTTANEYGESFTGYRPAYKGGTGISKDVISKMYGLGGSWEDTGYGLVSSNHIGIRYDGSYFSLNTLDGHFNLPELVLKGNASDWGSQILAHYSSFINDAWNGRLPRNGSFDRIINNQYYDLVSLGLDQAVAKTGSYLTKALDTKSTVNFTVLNQYAKPAFRTNVSGSLLETSKVANVAKGLKMAGNVLAGVGAGVSVYQVTTGQISKTQFAVDMTFTAIGFAGPAGAAVSLLYFGGKAFYEYQTGDTLFEAP